MAVFVRARPLALIRLKVSFSEKPALPFLMLLLMVRISALLALSPSSTCLLYTSDAADE